VGDGIYGAEAAARTYFRKSSGDLTAQEAALLAAAIPIPPVESGESERAAAQPVNSW
jgi:monofunctional biosynthetic peptidoglycan transglycosylase